ncbi:MAG: xanthine dehydrogenase family protein molybdopterin-binding subunit, partial [bacterium]|nr:xanthine dehydrogenase family protein molybdopterin-binding subunit [bacterium]
MATKTEEYLGIQEYKVVGTRPIRHDGVDKVTGRAVYGADVHLPRLLYGKTLRSPHAHARIKKIVTKKAEALPGVKAVITGADLMQTYEDKVKALGEGSVSLRHLITNVLAGKKVLYEGHAVAAVVATSNHIAEEALELIEVEYEVLAPVLNVQDAMADGAPLLHEDLKMRSLGEQTDRVGNIANHFQHKLGDIEKAFAEADVVVEREFHTQTVHQGYIEPHNVTANWNEDGQITVWCSTQGPFDVRSQVADVVGVPPSHVRVIPTEIGGGFGGKFRVYQEPTAAILSRKTGHPVKMVMSRTEVLKATGPTPGSFIRVKMGATKEGKLIAAQAYLAYEAGAYPGSPVGAGAGCIFSPYNIENVVIDGYDVVVNKPQTSAYRAPGATNAAFGSETVIDEIAEKLGVDPLEFRLKNSAKEGTRRADGPI